MDSEDIATSSPNGSPNEPTCWNWEFELYVVFAPISILCCLIIILAITIPLFDKEERNKMSAYNLYLVYLAIPDLIMSIADILLVTKCGVWRLERVSFLVISSFLANLLVNTVILYELLKLLVDSKTRRRYTPPSLFKASIQALAVYAISIIAFVVMDSLDKRVYTFYVLSGCTYIYMCWVLFRICYGRLLCYNSDTLDRLKPLVIYFSRIIALNFATGIALILANLFQGGFFPWLLVQIWIAFGLALTKADVLEYVRRLFACIVRPCSKIGSSLGKNEYPTHAESEPNETENPSRDPEAGDPGDYDEGDKHEDGCAHIKEETEDCDRQETTEVTTTTSAK